MLNDDMKTLAAMENIQIKLRGPSNFLAWMENISSLTQKLPESTSDLKILSIVKNSIGNKYDLKEVEEMTVSSPSEIVRTQGPKMSQYPSNIQLSLNLYSRLKAVNLDVKIETTYLDSFEQKTLMSDRRAKYHEQQVVVLERSPRRSNSRRTSN